MIKSAAHRKWLGTAMAVATLFAATGVSYAKESVGFANEIAELRAISNVVIIGFVERQEIGMSETTAQIRVIKSFSASVKEGQTIPFKTRSGRVRIQKNQPDLTEVGRAVFFLTQDTSGAYSCVRDNYGFKPIIHDNVYTNPQNPLETVKLKKYQQSLTTASATAPTK